MKANNKYSLLVNKVMLIFISFSFVYLIKLHLVSVGGDWTIKLTQSSTMAATCFLSLILSLTLRLSPSDLCPSLSSSL